MVRKVVEREKSQLSWQGGGTQKAGTEIHLEKVEIKNSSKIAEHIFLHAAVQVCQAIRPNVCALASPNPETTPRIPARRHYLSIK